MRVHCASTQHDLPSLLLVLLVLAGPGVSGVGSGDAGSGPVLVSNGETGGVRSLVGVVGQDVELDCTVRRLGDKSVSWVRSRDLQIMSHAGAVFTADARVSAECRTPGAGLTVHTLRIARLRIEDAGRYECQLNTEPKMSLFFNITVLEHAMPVAVVSSGSEVVRSVVGGAVTLECEAHYSPSPPAGLTLPSLHITWTRDSSALDATSGRGGVSLERERWWSGSRSSLTLGEVVASDAGVYWCGAGDARVAQRLQVIETTGAPVEGADAMQGDAVPDAAARGSSTHLHHCAHAHYGALPLLLLVLLVVRALGP